MPANPTDANVALVNRFFDDVMNFGNPREGATLLAPDFVVHHSALPGGRGTAADVAKLMATFRAAFPDLHYEIQDHVAQADEVATRWVATGTHRGTFFGVPATGKHVSVGGTDIFRVADGRLTETWVSSDLLGLMQQLGAFPPAPASAAPASAAPAPAGR